MTASNAFPVVTETAPESHHSIWQKILDCLNQGKYNEAYTNVLQRKDSFDLVRLMGRTGVGILDKLDSVVIAGLLPKVIELINSEEFIEMLLGWVIAVVDRKIALSPDIRASLTNTLSNICEGESKKGRLDEMQLSEANRAYNILKV